MSAGGLDVAIIGAGIGGLSCAVRLARAGLSVAVFEKQRTPGGFATCFRRGPFRFDASLHRMDAVGEGEPNRELLEELGIASALDLQPDEVLRKEVRPEFEAWIGHGPEGLRSALARLWPSEEAGLAGLLDLARRVHVASYASLADTEEPRPDAELLSLQRLTGAAVLGRYLTHPSAIDLVGGIGHYLGLPPERIGAHPLLTLIWAYHGLKGYYLTGGSQALTDALVGQLAAAGGTLHLGASVSGVLVENGVAHGIRCESGEEVNARWVVSDIPPPTLFGRLVPPDAVPPRVAARLRRAEHSCSVRKVWLGTDCDPRELGDLPFETNLIAAGMRLGVHLPSILDPGCAPPGGGVVSITTPAEPCGESAPDGNYEEEWRRRMESAVEERLLPGLGRRVVVRSMATPHTFHRFGGSPGGSILGFAPTPEQSGLRGLGPLSGLGGLVLTGAWVRPGSGLTAVMMSGRQAARAILRRIR